MRMSSISLSENKAVMRRANDYLVDPKRFRAPELLFDVFWREGEVAFFFGPPSSGKTIFAVQLGDALARGGGLYGFRHPRGRRRVLYVDLRHTDEQFQMRCVNRAVRHKFPKNLFRERPPTGGDLFEWLRVCVTANKVQVVIIDDLSAVKNTHDGTRETLRLVRRLRELRDEMGISILVIADAVAPPTGSAVSEADLGRSRVLCTVADSVFAIGRGLKRTDDHYFVQTRLRTGPIFWTLQNAPVAQLRRMPTGLLAFQFDERFSENFDEKKRRLICEVARLAEVEGKTFREIAALLGISKSWACTLYKRWTPAMDDTDRRFAGARQDANAAGEYEISDEYEDDEYEDDEYDDDQDVDEADADGSELSRPCDLSEPAEPDDADCLTPNFDPRHIPFAASLARRWIRDLETGLDGYGREIFVESLQDDGKPLIWYTQNRRGDYTRHERTTVATNHRNLGPSGQIPR